MSQTQKLVSKKTAVSAPKGTKMFVFREGMRPVSGARLFAYTAAALAVLGLASGLSVRREAAEKVMGRSAVKNHTNNGNFVEKGETLALSKDGKAMFQKREDDGRFDKKLSKAFVAALKSGKGNEAARIPERNLVPITLVLR